MLGFARPCAITLPATSPFPRQSGLSLLRAPRCARVLGGRDIWRTERPRQPLQRSCAGVWCRRTCACDQKPCGIGCVCDRVTVLAHNAVTDSGLLRGLAAAIAPPPLRLRGLRSAAHAHDANTFQPPALTRSISATWSIRVKGSSSRERPPCAKIGVCSPCVRTNLRFRPRMAARDQPDATLQYLSAR